MSTLTGRSAKLLAGAALLRLSLLLLVPDSVWEGVANHVIVVDPLTRWKPLAEGAYLLEHGMSPYDGGPCHQQPILLAIAALLTRLPSTLISAVYMALDLVVGYLLIRVGEAYVGPRAREVGTALGEKMAFFYLFNPVILATTMARSSLVYTHITILASLLFMLFRKRTWAMFAAAFSTYLSLYPLMLLPPIVVGLMRRYHPSLSQNIMVSCIGAFFAWFSLLQMISFFLTGSWDYAAATYGFILSVPDFTPTIGLWWYYLTEMFDAFRTFFTGALQLHVFAFAIPVTLRFTERPTFALWLLLGISNAFKSYSSIGDIGLTLALLPLFKEVFPFMRYQFLIGALFIHAIALALPFWHLWIHWGSGNANFFFAVTLVWAGSQIILLVDVVYGMLRAEFEGKWPSEAEKPLIRI